MSTINTNVNIRHQDTGMTYTASSQRSSTYSGFSLSEITVVATDEEVQVETLVPREVHVRLLSGDALKVGLASGTYPFRLSGANDSMSLRLDVEGIREITTIVCGADSGSSLGGKYFDLQDRNGTVRVVLDMPATAAFGSITYGTPAIAVAATGTLTSNNTNVSDGDQFTIGVKTYTFKTALTPTEGEVLIGADADASLLNLIRAINHTGTPDTHYKCAIANTQVSAAASVTAHAFLITALAAGYAGNYSVSFPVGTTLSLGATLTGGLNSTSVVVNGTTCTYVASDPGANQFSTIAQLNTLVNDIATISSTASATVVSIVADTAGTAGNSITLALGSNIAGTATAVSGSTLTGGSAASPSVGPPVGGRNINLTLVEDSASTVVATAVKTALDADSEFVATVVNSTVTVTDTYTGVRSPASAGDTGWSAFVETQAGAASSKVHLKSVGSSRVLVCVVPD